MHFTELDKSFSCFIWFNLNKLVKLKFFTKCKITYLLRIDIWHLRAQDKEISWTWPLFFYFDCSLRWRNQWQTEEKLSRKVFSCPDLCNLIIAESIDAHRHKGGKGHLIHSIKDFVKSFVNITTQNTNWRDLLFIF